MKKIIYLAVAVILLQVLAGCSKEMLLYSCDKETNEWVKTNLAEIQQMNRNDVLKLSVVQQQGCFNAFTPEQRYNVWINKLIQARNVGLNSSEITHIDLLLSKMKVEWYDKKTRGNAVRFAEINDFTKKWIDDAFNVLGWSVVEVGSIAASLYDVEKEDNIIVLKTEQIARASMSCMVDDECLEGLMCIDGVCVDKDGKKDCNCHTTESSWLMCNSLAGYKCIDSKTSGCDPTSWGCGLLWFTPCNGLCKK